MYRYSVDNAVTYTPQDVVLFRESPFACWMERLTLENPDHGIPPDIHSGESPDTVERQDDIVETLRAEGRDVVRIDADQDEPMRRASTLEAMRSGADFIVNGLLALGPLSGSVNLMMRTSGYSELGDFLYVPCDTQTKTTLHSAFRLCFMADLLHSLQGQLPPQMLIIRGGADVVPLQTEDHIYYYRAVKQRFMAAMRSFRKHRMPDPAESSHFGRWSECANEVLKQHALREEEEEEEQEQEEDARDEGLELPMLQVANAAGQAYLSYDFDAVRPADPARQAQARPSQVHPAGQDGSTLAEQARMLTPDTYKGGAQPGPTPNLVQLVQPGPVVTEPHTNGPVYNRRSSDLALQNLEFIGSSSRPPLIGEAEPFAAQEVVAACAAPAPGLREVAEPEERPEPGESPVEGVSIEPVKPHPLDSDGFNIGSRSVVDMDAAPVPALAPVPATASAGFELERTKDPLYRKALHTEELLDKDDDAGFNLRAFSDSLITSDQYDD